MVHPIVMRIGASPLGRAGLAIVTILGLAAGAQAVLPWACSAGAALCADMPGEAETELLLADLGTGSAAASPEMSAEPDAPVRAEPETEKPAVTAAQLASGTGSAAEAAAAMASGPGMKAQMPAPLVAQGDLIASTFAALSGRPQGAVASRSVRTVRVGADGQVAAEAEAAPAAAEASSEPAAVEIAAAPAAKPEPAPEAKAKPAAEPEAKPAEEEDSSLAYAPASGANAKVLGQGANVRSLPKRGGSEVLFALAGGAEVTIVEMSGGWAKVVDARGRSGWIYQDLLRRQ